MKGRNTGWAHPLGPGYTLVVLGGVGNSQFLYSNCHPPPAGYRFYPLRLSRTVGTSCVAVLISTYLTAILYTGLTFSINQFTAYKKATPYHHR